MCPHGRGNDNAGDTDDDDDDGDGDGDADGDGPTPSIGDVDGYGVHMISSRIFSSIIELVSRKATSFSGNLLPPFHELGMAAAGILSNLTKVEDYHQTLIEDRITMSSIRKVIRGGWQQMDANGDGVKDNMGDGSGKGNGDGEMGRWGC